MADISIRIGILKEYIDGKKTLHQIQDVPMFKGYLGRNHTMQTGLSADLIKLLHEIRASVGTINTPGLSDEEISRFMALDLSLIHI